MDWLINHQVFVWGVVSFSTDLPIQTSQEWTPPTFRTRSLTQHSRKHEPQLCCSRLLCYISPASAASRLILSLWPSTPKPRLRMTVNSQRINTSRIFLLGFWFRPIFTFTAVFLRETGGEETGALKLKVAGEKLLVSRAKKK